MAEYLLAAIKKALIPLHILSTYPYFLRCFASMHLAEFLEALGTGTKLARYHLTDEVLGTATSLNTLKI